MKGGSDASSFALSLKKMKDFYVLFQSGPGMKECLSKLKTELRKNLQGQIPIWSIWGWPLYMGLVFQSRGLS